MVSCIQPKELISDIELIFSKKEKKDGFYMQSLSRTLIAVGLAVIMLCVSLALPTESRAETTTISVQVLYDESFRFLFGVGEPSLDRARQIVEYSAFPLESRFGISLDVDYQRYESVLGNTYAAQHECQNLWTWGEISDELCGRVWHLSGKEKCGCYGDEQCFTTANNVGHHGSAQRNLNIVYNYASSSQYDKVVALFGHALCYTWTYSPLNHGYVGGLASGSDKAAIVHSGNGSGHDLTENSQNIGNFITTSRYFTHEFSHLIGAHDKKCADNTACVMCGALYGIVSVNNPWCSTCTEDINEWLVSTRR